MELVGIVLLVVALVLLIMRGSSAARPAWTLDDRSEFFDVELDIHFIIEQASQQNDSLAGHVRLHLVGGGPAIRSEQSGCSVRQHKDSASDCRAG